MAEFSKKTDPTVSREEIRRQLARLQPPLRVLGENWLAAATTIDFVTVDPAGNVPLLLVGGPGEDAALFTRALGHRAWAAARLQTWRELAPDAGIAVDARVNALLVCSCFEPETLAAAESLGGAIGTLQYRQFDADGDLVTAFESATFEPAEFESAGGRPAGDPSTERPLGSPTAPNGGRSTAEPAPRGTPGRFKTLPFRSGLTEEDLGLTPEEISEFS